MFAMPTPSEASAHLARAATIKFKTHDAAEVSIIIPIFNQLELTLACLESMVRHQAEIHFEVIVIDDHSEKYVPEVLSGISGLKVFSNETNQGFVLSCNRGAAEARGQYVLFLNNDTEVHAGWLESLVKVFGQRPKAGAVGAKLLYPDGRLQEAGCIIGDDGTGWNYGRDDDPERPEYNYLRQVDYCSGACLIVPRQLFLDLGGFDTRYQPAYYEHTDLAFAIRAAGKEVYYQPAARVTHFEGVSSGTNVQTGVKRHQVINREKFLAKWAPVLRHASIDPSMVELARDRHAPCRILVVDACALTPDADAGSLRMFNLMSMLTRHGAKVTFAATNLQVYEPYSTQLRLDGVEHLAVPHVCNLKQYLVANAYAFDVVILSRKSVANEFLDTVRKAAPATRIIFDTVDLMYLRLSRQAEVENSDKLRAEAERSKAIELELCEKSDLVFVVSHVEAELLGQHIDPAKISLVSTIHELYPNRNDFKERWGVMFVGGFQHTPNLDAVEFFLDEVLPEVVKRLPDIEFHIVGSNMPPRLRHRAHRHIHIHGYVPDLNELYARVRLTIAPLRYGAGVKGKVNQSMAHGVPVVATTIATEAMHLVHETDVMVADTAADFADAVVQLHQNEALWRRISAGGIRNIEQHFSIAAVDKELVGALGHELFRRKGAELPLPRRPAASYNLGDKLLFGRTGNSQNYTQLGWAPPEDGFSWMIEGKSSLDFQLPANSQPSKIRATILPFLGSGALKKQRLYLIEPANSSPSEITLEAQDLTEVEWTLDPSQIRSTRLTLTFLCPDAVSPAQLSASNDTRKLSFAFFELTIVN